MNIIKLTTATLLTLGLATSLMAGSALSQSLIKEAKKTTQSISPKELKKLIDNEEDFWFVDVREPWMIPEGSIDGGETVEIPRGIMEFDIGGKIKKHDELIVVYCRSGKSAVLAAETLNHKMHYKNVKYLEGGLNGWLDAGYSIYNAFGELKLAE